MIKQRVITINIYAGKASESTNQIQEVELDILNKYLDEGFTVIDRFATRTNSALYINITFVLQKET